MAGQDDGRRGYHQPLPNLPQEWWWNRRDSGVTSREMYDPLVCAGLALPPGIRSSGQAQEKNILNFLKQMCRSK